jgi:hypothetical protein
MTPARSSTRAGGAEVEDKLQNLILDSLTTKVKKDKLQMMGGHAARLRWLGPSGSD